MVQYEVVWLSTSERMVVLPEGLGIGLGLTMLSLAKLFPNSHVPAPTTLEGGVILEALQIGTPVNTWGDKASGLIFLELHDKTN